MAWRWIGLFLFLLVSPRASWAQNAEFDLLILGGRLLDGSGNPWVQADLAIDGGRIVAIGRLAERGAREVLNAGGLYVAPGFIDPHSHAGPALETAELSEARPLLAQGVTTVIINPDGGGPWDLEAQRERLQQHGLGLNVGLLVPHGAVRRRVLGMENRPPSPQELEQMRALVSAGMQAGAFGLSSGLFYAPGNFASSDELVELARIAAAGGGVYTSHIRDEADYSVGVAAAVEEVIQVAARARLPGIVTHIKALGPRVWGVSAQLVRRIEMARLAGVEVFADQYPYEASATGLAAALVPRWAEEGGRESLLERLKAPSQRLLTEMAENLERRGGAARIGIRSFPPDTTLEGMDLQAIASQWQTSPLQAALQMIVSSDAGIVSYNMDSRDVERLMVQPWVMTCSDGGLTPFGEGVPHPRDYGTFPRKIRHYVLEKEVLDLAGAIRSMTSLPATVLRLNDRGWLRPGAVADIVVFDLETMQDRATFSQPHQLSEGVVHLLVGGRWAIRDGNFTGQRAGQVLRLRAKE